MEGLEKGKPGEKPVFDVIPLAFSYFFLNSIRLLPI